ncbi:hypothetical protein QQ045_000253 [Rhodiola kirilowii]
MAISATIPATSTTHASSSTSIPNVTCLADDPLYVNITENVISLVTQPLVGDKNYLNWPKSMEMALGMEMEVGLVRGEFPRPTDAYQGSSLIHADNCMHAWEDLEDCFSGSNDFTVFSTQQEIAMLMQEDKSIAQYYNKLIQFWGDEDSLTEEISCELGSR